jgi:lysophospholipase L1-like esterase
LDNGNRGGWVKRLGPLLKVPAVQNLGVPGITTSELYSRLKKAFRNPNSSLRARALDADIFIIGAGANDFYDHGDPSLTARNLKRIVAMVRQELGRGDHVAPYVLLAKLTPTTRGFQRSFMENVNILLARYRSDALPSYLRFDLMDELEVSYDGLHPRATGYVELASIAASYIKGEGTTRMLALRPDSDSDGIFDKFETSSFGTNPNVKDTDVDGLSDGNEQFTYGTNPLLSDTDADGTSDGDEVAVGRNPLAAD